MYSQQKLKGEIKPIFRGHVSQSVFVDKKSFLSFPFFYQHNLYGEAKKRAQDFSSIQ
jgi:hypothetical protein